MTSTGQKHGPLSGVRVLDLTSVLMGPYCTQILADLGADVVKVESPDGDTSRYVGPSKTKGRSGMFANLNRGKRGIVLDLRTAEGRKICLQLAEKADIVLHSMRLPAIQRLGLDYAAVSAVNPGVIYASLYGYGRNGRYSGRPAYDDTIQAVSGLTMLQAEINPEPQYVTTVLGDKVCALSAAYAIMAALFHRQRGGGGQEIEVPMFEIMASFLLVEHIAGAAYDPPLGPPVYTRTVTPHRRPYRTRNGYVSVLVYNDKQWRRFTELAGRPDLAADERFASQAARSANMADFCAMVAEIIAERTSEEWLELLDQAEIPCARLNSMADLYTDPHLSDVGFFRDLDDPHDGRLRLPFPPVRFSQTPADFKRAGPMLGEHTAEVLREIGLSEAELDQLEQRGAIRRWQEKTTA
ncbi:MAG TPA: CoA transferase [Ferrovibrio sp.]|jgi:crotonobetainyl-CoA:carnitine CoA-transferase CaiB-like acyl-CoA transferase|uniref:CaiB/BaiF CoA transferase family protein n=1 Tax=Ferrovibrio sp. TaxID=1917215 RepID=UPI002B4B658F|nr:CoA transferase [Ferrovibrio sp.]HLT77392.1 CoA transferase [Ferrovibrio sp.]